MRLSLSRTMLPLAILVAGCVTPTVSMTPYQIPYFAQDDFERVFKDWSAGKGATWEVHYKGTAFSDQELVIKSNGEGSLGARLEGVEQPKAFTVSDADLGKLVTGLVDSGIFNLYDGHYGAWLQDGGLGGPEIHVLASGLEKRVSKDPGLSSVVSWEAGAIEKASDTVLSIGRKYLKQ